MHKTFISIILKTIYQNFIVLTNYKKLDCIILCRFNKKIKTMNYLEGEVGQLTFFFYFSNCIVIDFVFYFNLPLFRKCHVSIANSSSIVLYKRVLLWRILSRILQPDNFSFNATCYVCDVVVVCKAKGVSSTKSAELIFLVLFTQAITNMHKQ